MSEDIAHSTFLHLADIRLVWIICFTPTVLIGVAMAVGHIREVLGDRAGRNLPRGGE